MIFHFDNCSRDKMNKKCNKHGNKIDFKQSDISYKPEIMK